MCVMSKSCRRPDFRTSTRPSTSDIPQHCAHKHQLTSPYIAHTNTWVVFLHVVVYERHPPILHTQTHESCFYTLSCTSDIPQYCAHKHMSLLFKSCLVWGMDSTITHTNICVIFLSDVVYKSRPPPLHTQTHESSLWIMFCTHHIPLILRAQTHECPSKSSCVRQTLTTSLDWNSVTYTWVVSYMNESCHIWMSHAIYERVFARVNVSSGEVGGWGRDPKKCTGRDWGMGSSTI